MLKNIKFAGDLKQTKNNIVVLKARNTTCYFFCISNTGLYNKL